MFFYLKPICKPYTSLKLKLPSIQVYIKKQLFVRLGGPSHHFKID